jgi:hypothetical protein
MDLALKNLLEGNKRRRVTRRGEKGTNDSFQPAVLWSYKSGGLLGFDNEDLASQ